jgi:hypothetical protein
MATLRSTAATLLLAACLGLSACGSDDTKTESSGTKTETTTDTKAATEATTEAAPEEATGDSEANKYPASLTEEYTKSCVPSAVSSSNGALNKDDAATICQDTLECIQKELTSDEFIAVSSKMMSGEQNPDAKIFTDCATEAGKAFKK